MSIQINLKSYNANININKWCSRQSFEPEQKQDTTVVQSQEYIIRIIITRVSCLALVLNHLDQEASNVALE